MIPVPARRRQAVCAAALVALLACSAWGPLERPAVARAGAQAPGAGPRTSAIDAQRLIADLRALSSPDLQGRLTGTPGNLRAQALIRDRFKALGLRPIDGSYDQPFSFTTSGGGGQKEFPKATNLLGLVPGTASPDTFVIVSAHYDHLGVRDGAVYPGADDNASGVAALLALAAWFVGHPARSSILFVAFDGEEQGLQGARHFVAHPPIDLRRVTTVVNMDMIGRGDKATLFVAGTYQNPSLKPLATAAATGSTLRLAFGHDRPKAEGAGLDDWTNQSDHGPFHAAGVPFLYFGVEDHPDYHKPTDTADRIPRDFYVEAVAVILETIERLANAPAR